MRVGGVLVVRKADENESSTDGISTPAIASITDSPVALTEVLGESILHRQVESLRRHDVDPIFVVTDDSLRNHPVIRSLSRCRVQCISAPAASLENIVESTIARCAHTGIRAVLAMEASVYAELDVPQLLQFHLASEQRATFVNDEEGSLPITMIGSQHSEIALPLMRNRFILARSKGDYLHCGYVNRLANPGDLRRLAKDALAHRCRIRPNASEVSPGVWVADSARIHPEARIIGPVYVGPHAVLRRGTTASSFAVIERNSHIDRGTVVRDSSVLANTYVGVCLNVSNVVINRSRLADVARNVSLEMGELALIGPAAGRKRVLAPAFLHSLAHSSSLQLRAFRQRLSSLAAQKSQAAPATSKITYGVLEAWRGLKTAASTTDPGSI